MEPVLAIAKVCKRFRSRSGLRPWARPWVTALDGVSLEIARGEGLALVGPNGSGKTTLLKSVATLILPDSGTIRVCGVDALERPRRARAHVGLILAEERSFYWRLTLRENLRFFATLQDLTGRARTERVEGLIEHLGLGDQARRPFRELSSGIRQRAAIARGLLNDPALLLCDEVTRGLDARAAAGFLEHLGREIEEHGRAVLFASHRTEELADLCRRTVVLDRGRVAHGGETGPVVERYLAASAAAPGVRT